MRKILLMILLSAISLCSMAKGTEESGKLWQADLYGGLYINNEQAWQLEPSITWNFHKYIGVSLGLEFTSQYNQPSRSTEIDGHKADLADNERNVA